MNKINRKSFLKMGSLAMMAPLITSDFFNAAAAPANHKKRFRFNNDNDLLKRLVVANDKQVAELLQSTEIDKVSFSRKIGHDFAVLSASYCYSASSYYHSPVVITKLEALTALLAAVQSEDGTVNIGNLESPPDTAFLLEPLSAGAFLLKKDNSPGLTTVNNNIKKFIVKSGEALVTGGVHTPNHRWVICAALSRLNALYPNQKYLDRIGDWMGEGIFMDSDGHYPERSQNYANVENNSLITMGRLLNKPALFDFVGRNLDMTWYYADPNGDLVTTDSRRQDQYMSKSIVSFYLHYRYMAISQQNSKFAGITKQIEQLKGFDEDILQRSLFHFLEDPLLQQELPVASTLLVDYEKLFATSSLLRIRRKAITTTLFGGVDWPVIIASGRSNSPNFFSFRKGNAILKYIRFSSSFFSMGYFYSEGIQKEGNAYILHKKLEVPYYQPLPKDKRNSSGDYKLSPSIDDRFWNKMDFEDRKVSNVKTLSTTVTLNENNGTSELTFDVSGQAGVSVTIELCFLENGKLSGVSSAENGNSFLEQGMGTYEYNGDTIRFGPGAVDGKSIKGLEGERYSTHFGSLRTEGMHVYITGVTPFKHKLTIG
jgi:hypothetical protein